MKYYTALTSLVFLTFSPLHGATAQDSCTDETLSRAAQELKLDEQIQGLSALLKGESFPIGVDLKDLFGVDSLQTGSAKVELNKTLKEPEEIWSIAPYSAFQICKEVNSKEKIQFEQKAYQVLKLKRDFFKLSEEERDHLMEVASDTKEKEAIQRSLEQQIRSTKKEIKRQGVDTDIGDIEYLKFVESLKYDNEALDTYRSRLSELDKEEVLVDPSPESVSSILKDVTEVWRSVALLLQKSYTVFGEAPVSIQDARTLELVDLFKARTFRVLSFAGRLRAKVLDRCDAVNCARPEGIDPEYLKDLVLEIRIVPLKFASGTLSEWVDFRAKWNTGLKGWVDLSKQAAHLILLLLIPFVLIRIFKWVSRRLDLLRRSFLSRSMMNYRKRTRIAIWIAKLNPFIPNLGMLMSVAIVRMLIERTDLKELSPLFFYIQAYYVYALSRLLLAAGLEVIFATDIVDQLTRQKLKIEMAARRISILVFSEYLILHIIEDTVRKALAYRLFSDFIFIINVIFFLFEVKRWDLEIIRSFKKRFQWIWSKIEIYKNKKTFSLLLPFLAIGVVAHDLVNTAWYYLSKLDFIKRILSSVFRKRLEGSEVEDDSDHILPKKYRDIFDYYLAAEGKIYIQRDSPLEDRIINKIDYWDQGKEGDDLLILIGDRGMGKTTILKKVSEISKDTRETISVSIPPRITSSKDFFIWLSESLNHRFDKYEDFISYDQERLKKQVICVDDVHNLFLSRIGGFEAYRSFIQILSLQTEKVFWCVSVNKRAWDFLNGVFGGEHLYGEELLIDPWKEHEIQKLIIARHNETGISRKFDESIKAYGAGDSLGQQVEAQFFRLLWGQSRGNPRSSMMYWISSLSYHGGCVNVGVPSFVDAKEISEISDEGLFILAAIARHENLSFEEVMKVTQTEAPSAKKNLKEILDKELVWKDQTGRHRITSKSQYAIDYFLLGKNFLYE